MKALGSDIRRVESPAAGVALVPPLTSPADLGFCRLRAWHGEVDGGPPTRLRLAPRHTGLVARPHHLAPLMDTVAGVVNSRSGSSGLGGPRMAPQGVPTGRLHAAASMAAEMVSH